MRADANARMERVAAEALDGGVESVDIDIPWRGLICPLSRGYKTPCALLWWRNYAMEKGRTAGEDGRGGWLGRLAGGG